MKTYFSERIYKHTLSRKTNQDISHSLHVFNQMKWISYAWNLYEKRYKIKRYQDSMHLAIKRRFETDDYYANSAVQESKALHTSQEELKKIYLSLTEKEIESIKEKIKTTKTILTKMLKLKESIVKGKPKFPKRMGYKQHKTKNGTIYVIHQKKETKIWFHLYSFEHEYLDREIKRLKARIGQLNHRLFRKEQKKEKLKTKIPSVVFGSKKLFKHQFTKEEYKRNHPKWKQMFKKKRFKQMTISGRKDAKYGNFVFSYEPSTQRLHMKTINGKVVTFPTVHFPYGQEMVDEASNMQLVCKDKKKFGKSIAWSLEDLGDYYIIKVMITPKENDSKNYSRSDGIIGIDLNVDHIAWSDVNRDGQLIQTGTHYFSVQGKSSGQTTKILEAEAIAIVNEAVKRNKSIGMEKLDTTKAKSGGRYRGKKQNQLMSLFAYRKLTNAILSRAEKMGVEVFQVNPAYTSQIGKMKYMKNLHISIHQAASYTIGRRVLKYKEKVPKALKFLVKRKANEHHWNEWSQLTKKFRGLRPQFWYHVSNGEHLFSEGIINRELLQKEIDILQSFVPNEWLQEA